MTGTGKLKLGIMKRKIYINMKKGIKIEEKRERKEREKRRGKLNTIKK